MTPPVTNFETTPTTSSLRRYAPKAAPAIATTTVLTLARLWNANGAEHSASAATLMGVLALGTAAAGVVVTNGRHGDPTSSALTFTAAGTLAVAGVAAYSDELPLPLLLWAVATVLAYVLAFRYWREDRRDGDAHGRHMETLREQHRHVETVTTIQARALVDSRYLELQSAQESTRQASALVDALTTRAQLPWPDLSALAPTVPPQQLTARTPAKEEVR
ncbi:hypothetical protein [Streptomyces sp. BPTC-684]|uniref:hypothetical protein n=1 Tax=Streptomyces sp. BPTC-684 TaxID=3043734 RepID=UPI0024B0B585|nr:hypothetical protein [Streptomyces sp. BPTC-684]WHM41136.1 hypothetical protein QIY60_32615 [Streptomyces sp. BPTC-684]